MPSGIFLEKIMAKQAVVSPAIPAQHITPFDLVLLRALGNVMPRYGDVDVLRLASNNYYPISELTISLSVWEQNHPLAGEIPSIFNEGDKTVTLELGQSTIEVGHVLQVILKRCDASIEYILIEGAQTHTVMEPGAFGGFVTLVTRERVVTKTTEHLIDMLFSELELNRGE